MNDARKRALEDGEKLLREMEQRAAERERRRKSHIVVNMPVRRDADGVVITESKLVPVAAIPKGEQE